MFRLPQMASGQLQRTKSWIQTNRSDTIGNLAWTMNMDPYYNLGKIRPTRMLATDSLSSPVDTDMTDVPVGFRFFWNGSAQNIYTVAGAFVHASGGFPQSNFAKFTTAASYPTTCDSGYSDIETAFGVLYVTTNSNSVYYYNGSWNNFTAGGAGTGYTHQLTPYGGRLYMVHTNNQIISWNFSNTVATMGNDYTLNNGGNTAIDPTQYITFIRGATNRIWIGVGSVSNLSKGKGYIYEWDGVSQSTTRFYKLGASAPMACVLMDDIPYVMDSNGRLLKFNSGAFQEIARLPLFDKYLGGPLNAAMNNKFIHPNGMSVINGKINMLIDNMVNDNTGTIIEQCPSGIWEYDETIGLYHKYSLSYTPSNSNTITDYGQNRLSAVGGLSDMKVDSTNANLNGTFLAGATIFKDGTNAVSQVWTNDTLPFAPSATHHSTLRAGYFVTTKLESQGLTEKWKGIAIKYKNYIDNAEKIVVKYRTSEVPPLEVPITWVDTTHFTTTSDISAYTNLGSDGVGDEVEITQGTGGGMCSHITNTSLNAGTYTVTVDEVHTGVTTGTARARFQHWQKSGVALNSDKQFEQFNLPMMAASTWIQIKVFMIMDEGDEFCELGVINSVSQDYN